MKFSKRLSHGRGIQVLLSWLVARYIRFVYRTSRWQVVRREVPEQLWKSRKPFILAFWHGRLLMMPYCWSRGAQMNMLISWHRDGELIARTISHFDIGTVRGSPKKGGARALRAMVRQIQSGESVGITPDGPRGPRMRASLGIVSAAQLSGVPVVPVSVATSRRKVLRSWDRFLVALPWSRGAFVWGEQINIARNADDETVETARLQIESQLNEISEQADRLCDREPIAPAPLMKKPPIGGSATENTDTSAQFLQPQ